MSTASSSWPHQGRMAAQQLPRLPQCLVDYTSGTDHHQQTTLTAQTASCREGLISGLGKLTLKAGLRMTGVLARHSRAPARSGLTPDPLILVHNGWSQAGATPGPRARSPALWRQAFVSTFQDKVISGLRRLTGASKFRVARHWRRT
jgi:hypothetical protein